MIIPAEENQHALRQIVYEAFNKGNYNALREFIDPNFIEHQLGLHATIEGMHSDIEFFTP